MYIAVKKGYAKHYVEVCLYCRGFFL